jgi:glycogen debranching enzyme
VLDQLWNGERFVARHLPSGELLESETLIETIPLVLGDELPTEIRQKVVGRLKRYLTPHGLATEWPESPHYTPDGYWRGPVWAPSTYLIIDGLRRSGETGLAEDIAGRFRKLCATSGFAENFDALTGAPLRDKAYTWTSSVFLLLATGR